MYKRQAIAHRDKVLEIDIAAGHDPGALLEVLTQVNALPHAVMGGHRRPIWAQLPPENCHRPDVLNERLAQRFGAAATLRDDRGSVTLVGPGLGEAPDVTLAASAIIRELTSDAEMVLGPLELAFIVPRAIVPEAVKRLHAALFEGKA